MKDSLSLRGMLPITGENAGYCVTKGVGQHVTRIIESYEIIYVKSGTLGIAEEGIAYEVMPGQVLILTSGRKHGGTRPFEKDLSFYWLHFKINNETQRAQELFALPSLIRLSKPEYFIELMRKYIKWEGSQIERDLILFKMLLEMQESLDKTNITSIPALATKADNYIRQHFEEELTTATVAEATGCNPDYLGRIYAHAFNKTITKSIQGYRMSKAARMLIEGNQNVNEISNACGYIDVRQFRRIFKHFHGLTPKEYQKKYGIIE